MREKLLQWLKCPACNGELIPEGIIWNNEEIDEGMLNCSCGNIYPIIGGVPRLLLHELLKELPRDYPDYFYRHPNVLNEVSCPVESELNGKKTTMDRFGYEWTHFNDYDCDNFQQFIAPLPSGFFEGKVGLDVGCGAGRHAKLASKYGAEIIAIDLSPAVDSAQQYNKDNRQVHVVQADIFNLPFKGGIFNFIYSLGVLHHLPEPEEGYQILSKYLSKDGSLFVWLYAYAPRKVLLEILRYLSLRLSNRNIMRMAFMCNLVDYGFFVGLYKLLKDLPVLKKFVRQHTPLRIKEYASYGYRVSFTDWFDRLSAPITNYYKQHEVQGWLQRSRLQNTKLERVGDSWWWLYGEKKG